MKKLLLLALVSMTMVLGSCTKEARLNRGLDGKWEIVTFGGASPSSLGMTVINDFIRNKKGNGTYTKTTTSIQGTSTETGSYTITGDTKMETTSSTGLVTTFTINEYSKTDIKVTDVNGVVITMKKK